MKQLLHLLKFKNKLSLRSTFFDLLSEFVSQYNIGINRFDYIVPIPLYPTRFRERGYNQSRLIAEDISALYNNRLLVNNLMRTRHTQNQALLGKKERWTNIHGAFKIRNPFDLKNTSILLVDDLLTTGATVSEAARTLKNAGALEVSVLTLAIAL